jgi:hypothetical protein
MTTAPQFKPGKIGIITAVLQLQNIGIDGKIYQIVDARVDRVKQDNPQIGDEVEYKISASKELTEKGKISFFAIKKRTGAPAEVPAEQPSPEKPATPKEAPAVIQNIQAEFVKRERTSITLKDCMGEEQSFRADLDVIKMLAHADSPVQPGKKYKVQLVQQGKEWVVARMGSFDESFGEKPFRTGSDILKENLDKQKAENEKAQAALAQIKKENEQGDQRIKENAETLKNPSGAEKTMPTSESTKEPEKRPQTANVALPDTLPATGGVEIAVHVNLGNYSSFDLKVTGINGEHARQLLQQEAAPTIVLAKGIIQEASKGY